MFGRWWGRVVARRRIQGSTLDLGAQVSDEQIIRRRIRISETQRTQSVSILGVTGSGKSFLNRHFAEQDVRDGRGFLYFDLHGDATPFLVGLVAMRERVTGQDLSERLIVIDPADPETSVGLNPLEPHGGGSRFLQVSEFTEVLKKRWHLDSFGARTDELLRNSLHVLADNGLTLLELGSLLSNESFRERCLQKAQNPEVREYFENRYDKASEPMRATMREPILNKITAFTADPRFRHIVGQQNSTFSVLEALDKGLWIVVNLHKGKLGDQAATLGSLFLALVKNAVFTRQSRELFTLYCDEIQNLVAYGAEIETILSEARKFAVGVVSANQFSAQMAPDVRAALLAVGTHVYFQLSSADAQQVAGALDAGRSLAERLKNLPRRHFVVKAGQDRWREGAVPFVREPSANSADLLARSRARWARSREAVEASIRERRAGLQLNSKESLDDWE
jgi:hypothetical protein